MVGTYVDAGIDSDKSTPRISFAKGKKTVDVSSDSLVIRDIHLTLNKTVFPRLVWGLYMVTIILLIKLCEFTPGK